MFCSTFRDLKFSSLVQIQSIGLMDGPVWYLVWKLRNVGILSIAKMC